MPIATVTLSNPGKLNAINFAMWQQLTQRAVSDLSADEQVRCVVLRGDGADAFAAGGDLEEFVSSRDTLERAIAYHAAGQRCPAARSSTAAIRPSL
jgi:enoyl-CoA hydratase